MLQSGDAAGRRKGGVGVNSEASALTGRRRSQLRRRTVTVAGYCKIVFSEPVDGREDEYNHWYDTVHAHETIRDVPGVVAVQRFRLVGQGTTPPSGDPLPRYLAIWEIEADDPEAARRSFATAKAAGLIPASEAFDLSSVVSGYFEPLGPRLSGSPSQPVDGRSHEPRPPDEHPPDEHPPDE